MLVLTRKNDQAVVIGGVNGLGSMVRVTVLAIEPGRVRLGFEAEKGVAVQREEVWERIRTDHPCASLVGDPALTLSRSGNGKSRVLSGTGKGRSPQSCEEPACETRMHRKRNSA